MGRPATIPPANPLGPAAPDGAPAKSGTPAKSQPAVTPGSLAACAPHEREDKAVFEDIYKVHRINARKAWGRKQQTIAKRRADGGARHVS